MGLLNVSPIKVEKVTNGFLLVNNLNQLVWVAQANMVLLDDAIPYFTARIDVNNDDSFAYFSRGTARRWKKEYVGAIADFGEAIRLKPTVPSYWNNRGFLYQATREYDKALADYGQAIRLEKSLPRRAVNYSNRGRLYHVMKEYDKALADFDEAVRLLPGFASALNHRGQTYFVTRKYPQALADYEECIRYNPLFAPAYHSRAWLWATCPVAQFRDGKKAVESAQKACELTGYNVPVFLTGLAAAHAETGDFEQAILWQKKALTFPDFAREVGEQGQRRLKLYEEGKPFRDEGVGPKTSSGARSDPTRAAHVASLREV